jgi:CHAT domain-containing protein/tetratricopeptide (TPR) repeat protein
MQFLNRPRRTGRRLLGTCVLVVGCLSAHRCAPAPGASDVVPNTAPVRILQLRLSDGDTWSSCPPRSAETVIAPLRCGPEADTSRAELAAGLEGASVLRLQISSPDTLRGASQLRDTELSDLQWAGVDVHALTRSLTRLEHLLDSTPDNAVILNALTVTSLLSAERSQSLRPLLRALDFAEHARGLAPTSAAVAFNLALVQERLFLLDGAQRSFAAAAELERNPSWKQEALQLAARLTPAATPVWYSLAADSAVSAGTAGDSSQIQARARRSALWRRDIAWQSLAIWGTAELAGDEQRAQRASAVFRGLAEVERVLGGDSSVHALAAHVSSQIGERRQRRALARAHIVLGSGVAAFRRGDFEPAAVLLRDASSRLHAIHSPAEGWARLLYASCLGNLGEYSTALTAFARVRAGADSMRMPGLRGRAQIAIGTTLARSSRLEEAERAYREALPDLRRAKDAEALGHVAFLLSEVTLTTGRRYESHAESLKAMQLLSPYRTSSYLQSEITQLAALARDERLSFAAAAIMSETVALSVRTGSPSDIASAYADRARDLLAIGATSAAATDVDSAAHWVGRLPAGRSSARLRAYLLLARGEVMRSQSASQSLTALQRAIAAFRAFPGELYFPEALYQAARSARALKHRVLEQHLLDEAIVHLDHQSAGFQSSVNRVAFGRTVERVFDAAITLRLDAGDPRDALSILERGRVASWQPGTLNGKSRRLNATGADPIGVIQRALPPRTTLIEFAVLDDRLCVWSISRTGWQYTTQWITRDSLRRMVNALPGELGESSLPVSSSARSRLFDALLRETIASRPSGWRVIVVPDRELFRVPFAALWDAKRKQSAIEQIEFRSAPSAAFALASLRRPVALSPNARILAIGNNARSFDREASLPPLVHSEAEATGVRNAFRQGRLLLGDDARRSTLQSELSDANVLHFAGHALFDEERPEQSFLLVGGDRAGTSGRLRAWEIAAMRPSKLALVVLSACKTLTPMDSRMGPATGLAFSFFESGASGIVSTMWDVDDAGTSALVARFHHNVLSGMTPAAALRDAQLEAMRSHDPRVRSARTWAAYTFSGA